MFTCTEAFLILSLTTYRTSSDSCVLRETSRYPWLVKIWKHASAKTVGHGALLSADKVLSSCNAFAHLSPDLANERYETIVNDFGGVDRQAPFCTDSRFANAILIHPKCNLSNPVQLHDFAMWNLESPFRIAGEPFLTSLLLTKDVILSHISQIGLNEPCRMAYAKDPTKRDVFGAEEVVGRCEFQNYVTLEVCESKNCTKQSADGLLCFYKQKESADSWKVRQPLETPDFIEGSVVLCSGQPVGSASRTFYSDDYEVYRMFSNFAENLDFLNVSSTPSTTLRTTQTSPSPSTNNTDAPQTTDGARNTIITTKLTTPINCKCPSYKASIHNLDGHNSIHEDHFWYILTALWIQSILQNF